MQSVMSCDENTVIEWQECAAFYLPNPKVVIH